MEAHLAIVRTAGRRGNRGTTAVATLGIILAFSLSGCGTSTTPSAKSSSPKATSSADPDAAAKAAVLNVYRRMWAAQVKAYATWNLGDPDLEKYAHDKALAGIKDTEFYYQQYNVVMTGQPVLSPKVTAISTQTQPYSATITDCVDSSRFVEVDKTTGKPVPLIDHRTHHVAVATARALSGRWVITNFAIERDRTC